MSKIHPIKLGVSGTVAGAIKVDCGLATETCETAGAGAAGTGSEAGETGAWAVLPAGKTDTAPTFALFGSGTAAPGAALIALPADPGIGATKAATDAALPGAAAGRFALLLLFNGSAGRPVPSFAATSLD